MEHFGFLCCVIVTICLLKCVCTHMDRVKEGFDWMGANPQLQQLEGPIADDGSIYGVGDSRGMGSLNSAIFQHA